MTRKIIINFEDKNIDNYNEVKKHLENRFHFTNINYEKKGVELTLTFKKNKLLFWWEQTKFAIQFILITFIVVFFMLIFFMSLAEVIDKLSKMITYLI